MDLFQLNSTNKRKRENDDCVPSSCKRHQLDREPMVQSTTKIVDINDDCLSKIFEYLDRKNLFNVAIASEWLRPSAAYVYKRQFGTKEVEIIVCDDFHSNPRANASVPELEDWDTYVTVRGLKTCLQFIRCFGSSINHLKINYKNSNSKRHEYVHHHINKYCAKSLARISFLNMPSISMEQFSQVFTNVKDVTFFHCDLGETLPFIAKWFINLRNMEFYLTRVTNGFDRTQFRHLEHLCIRELQQNDFGVKNAAHLLRSNRQIQSLEIAVHGQIKSVNTIFDMIKENASISKLVVEFCSVYDRVTLSDVERILSEHPSLVELHLGDFVFAAEDAITLIDQLISLQTFHFRVENSSEYKILESELDHNRYILTKSYDSCSIKLNCKN